MDNIDKDLLGVSKITAEFAKMGWTLRERGRIDYGIDADVEQKENSRYTNKHIALQIKSGDSYVKKKDSNGNVVFYVDEWHYEYWLQSDRPVIILFYDIEKDAIIWDQVCLSKIKDTSQKHKIVVNTGKILSADSKPELEDIIYGHKPHTFFPIKNEYLNFDYSIHCFTEAIESLDEINNEFAIFRTKIDRQISKPNSQILSAIFDKFGKQIASNSDLVYEYFCKTHWYIDRLASIIDTSQTKELLKIVSDSRFTLETHIEIWGNNKAEFSILFHPNVPQEVQRNVKRFMFQIDEYTALLKLITATQLSIESKIKSR